MQSETSKPWERQPDETSAAYRAFCKYRDWDEESGNAEDGLPGSRSLAKLAQKLGKKAGYTRHLEHWSSKYNWVERAQHYDQHLEQLARAEREEVWKRRREEQAEEEWRVRSRLLEKGLQILELPLTSRRVEKDVDGQPTIIELHPNFKQSDAKAMLELFSKLGRLATGLASGRHEITGKDGGPIDFQQLPDLSGLATDELRTVTHLLRKAMADSGGEGAS